MTKVHREFFPNGNLKKELYYDTETQIVSEMRRYNSDGMLIFGGRMEYEIKLEDALKTIKFTIPDASFIDEEALRQEQSREAVEVAREARLAEQRLLEEQRRIAVEAEARLKAAERFIGRTLGDNDLA